MWGTLSDLPVFGIHGNHRLELSDAVLAEAATIACTVKESSYALPVESCAPLAEGSIASAVACAVENGLDHSVSVSVPTELGGPVDKVERPFVAAALVEDAHVSAAEHASPLEVQTIFETPVPVEESSDNAASSPIVSQLLPVSPPGPACVVNEPFSHAAEPLMSFPASPASATSVLAAEEPVAATNSSSSSQEVTPIMPAPSAVLISSSPPSSHAPPLASAAPPPASGAALRTTPSPAVVIVEPRRAGGFRWCCF